MRHYLIFALLFSFFSEAKETMSTFSFINAGLMPQGVYTFGYNSSNASNITERYNNSSNIISNKEFSSENLSFNNVIDSSKNDLEKSLARAAFQAYGINLSEQAGLVQNNLDVNTDAKTYVIGYGLSKTSNFFVIIPTLEMSFNIESNFKASSTYNKLIVDLEASGQVSRANKLRKIKQNPLRESLADSGLSLPQEVSTVANIYLNYRKQYKGVVLDSYLILPSGYKSTISDMIDFKINEGSIGFKQGIAKAYQFGAGRLGLYGSYHLRTSFKQDYRIPRNEVDPFSFDIEDSVETKYGDQVESSLQYEYRFSALFTPYLGLQYLYSFKDSYKGERFSKDRYEILENETESRSLNLKFGFSLNSIEAFLDKKFLLPMDFNLQVSKNIYGKNSFVNDWVSLNMMVFYK